VQNFGRTHDSGVISVFATPFNYLFTGDTKSNIKKWSIHEEDTNFDMKINSGEYTVLCHAVTNNGRYLFSGSDESTIQKFLILDLEEDFSYKDHRKVDNYKVNSMVCDA